MCECQNKPADTMGLLDVPGYVPPYVGGGGISYSYDRGGDIGNNYGGDVYFDDDIEPIRYLGPPVQANTTPSPTTTTTTPAPAASDDKFTIDQQTLVVAGVVAAVLLLFAAK